MTLAQELFASGISNSNTRRSLDGTTWSGQNTGAPSRSVQDINGVRRDDLWMGGQEFSYQWNGTLWTVRNMGQGTDFDANGVWAVRSDYVWFAGHKALTNNAGNGRIVLWDGNSFVNQSIPSSAAEIWDVWAYDENLAYAVGETSGNPGQGLILKWDGVSWAVDQLSSSSDKFYGVWGTSPTNVWAVGARTIFNPLAYRFTGSWADVSGSVNDSGTSMQKIHGLDASNIWVVTTKVGKAYIRFFNGSSWSYQESDWGDGLSDVWAAGPEHVYAAGLNGRIVRYNGSSWSDQVSGTATTLNAIGGGLSYRGTLDVDVLSEEGGTEVTATGFFPTGETMTIHLGPNGDASDPPCYCGRGNGYEFSLREDEDSFSFVSAPTTKGPGFATLVHSIGTVPMDIPIVEREWRDKGFRNRKSHPPWSAVGARSLRNEGRR
jgi:hypothetical protein